MMQNGKCSTLRTSGFHKTEKGAEIGSISLNEVAGKLKLVNENHDLIVQGKRMGICFG